MCRACQSATFGHVAEHYDVIIVGSGAGGGTLANTLAPSGKRILLLERGNFLPRETENWDPGPVFVDGRYISPDTWFDADGKPFQPQVHYYVGGATKLYGAALYRLRPEDFGEIKHADGPSPAWPLGYDEFEPWYTKAEWLYQVHGNHGEDPTEGHCSKEYPWPAVSHEPRVQQISDALAALERRAFIGRLDAHGLPGMWNPVFSRRRREGTLPILDAGFVSGLREGAFRIVPGVEAFAGKRVVLEGDRSVAPDAVIAATGYRPALEALVGHLGLLDRRGDPCVHGADTDPAAPGVHFTGFRNPITGALRELRYEATAIAQAVQSR